MKNSNESFLNHMKQEIREIQLTHTKNNTWIATNKIYPDILGFGLSEDKAKDNLILKITNAIKRHHPLYLQT